METWMSFFGEAVRDGRLNDTEQNRAGYKRTWDSTGKALGKTKQPKTRPVPKTEEVKAAAPPKSNWWDDADETDWLYD
jgi:hypothetical protein